MIGDHFLNNGDFVRVLRLSLHRHVVDLGRDGVAFLFCGDDGDVGLSEQLQQFRVWRNIVGQNNSGDGAFAGESRAGNGGEDEGWAFGGVTVSMKSEGFLRNPRTCPVKLPLPFSASITA